MYYKVLKKKQPDLTTYRGSVKSLARPGRIQATATEHFYVHISNLLPQLEEY
jgi:hypothetical protein